MVKTNLLENLVKIFFCNKRNKLNCKVYHGPHIDNFKEIYNLLHSFKIAFEIKNEKELIDNLSKDLSLISKETKNISTKINALGNKILNDNITEINKILR